MINFIKRLFINKTPIVCGGEGCCEISDGYNRVIAKIYYSRPPSDLRLDYVYQGQKGIVNESRLREIQDAEDKAQKCHEIMIRDLSIPFAEKIFVSSEGFLDDNKLPLEKHPKEIQFKFLEKYHSHYLVDLVGQAFSVDSILKKKS